MFLSAFVLCRVRLQRFTVDIQCLKVPVLLVISLNLDTDKNSPLVKIGIDVFHYNVKNSQNITYTVEAAYHVVLTNYHQCYKILKITVTSVSFLFREYQRMPQRHCLKKVKREKPYKKNLEM